MSEAEPAFEAARPRYLAEAGFGPVVPRGWAPWSVLAVLLSIVFIVAGQIIGVLPAMAMGFIRPGEAVGEAVLVETAYLLYVAFGLATLLTIVWTVTVERRSLASIGFTSVNPVGRFVGGFGWGLVFLGATLGAMTLIGGVVVAEPASAWSDPDQLVWIAVMLAGFIVQGSTEEIVIRGWLMSGIAARLGAVAGARVGLMVAVLVTSAVFALLHGANPGAMSSPLVLINLGLFGVFIALFALYEGSIWGACGWHAAWNWALLTGFEIELSGIDLPLEAWIVDLDSADAAWVSGGAFGPEGSIVTTAVLALGCVVWGARLAARGLGARRDGLYG